MRRHLLRFATNSSNRAQKHRLQQERRRGRRRAQSMPARSGLAPLSKMVPPAKITAANHSQAGAARPRAGPETIVRLTACIYTMCCVSRLRYKYSVPTVYTCLADRFAQIERQDWTRSRRRRTTAPLKHQMARSSKQWYAVQILLSYTSSKTNYRKCICEKSIKQRAFITAWSWSVVPGGRGRIISSLQTHT